MVSTDIDTLNNAAIRILLIATACADQLITLNKDFKSPYKMLQDVEIWSWIEYFCYRIYLQTECRRNAQ